jgi:uncharacterized protein (DUF433 family)
MKHQEIGQYLVVDPEICHGQPTFKGTRVPVQTVLTFLSMGYTIDALLADWPELRREAIEEAIRLAMDALVSRYSPIAEAVA